MVLSEGFKDILNLKYILKVIFSSNYVIMVGLLAKGRVPKEYETKWEAGRAVPLEPLELGAGGGGGIEGGAVPSLLELAGSPPAPQEQGTTQLNLTLGLPPRPPWSAASGLLGLTEPSRGQRLVDLSLLLSCLSHPTLPNQEQPLFLLPSTHSGGLLVAGSQTYPRANSLQPHGEVYPWFPELGGWACREPTSLHF